jgi:saccharopine dehydrogenase-like NADP-dependent oxidoreductase
MKVLILGGAGLMAEATEIDFLEIDSDEISEITIADNNSEAVESRIKGLSSTKVRGEIADLDETEKLIRMMRKHDIVVHAANYNSVYQSITAALEAKVNIVTLVPIITGPKEAFDDIGEIKDEFMDHLNKDFLNAGLICLIGMGSAPGTVNVMGGYLGDKFDTIESMEFSYVYAHEGKRKTLFAFEPEGMIRQYTQSPIVLRDGEFTLLPPRAGREWAVYPDPIGRTERFYIIHDEARFFYRRFKDKGLKNVGTKAGWGSEFLKELELYDRLGLLDSEKRKFSGGMVAPLEILVKGAYKDKSSEVNKEKTIDYGCTRLEIKGEIDGQRLEYTGDVISRPYGNLGGTQQRTGMAAAIGVRMIGRGEISKKGCYSADYYVDPKIYFRELLKRNIEFSYTVRHFV